MNINTYSDAVDTRIVFRVYAAVAWIVSVFLLRWGPDYFPLELTGYPRGAGLVVIIVGAVLLAAGCFALATSYVESPAARKRALLWWAVAHTAPLSAVALEVFWVQGRPGVGAGLALGGTLTAAAVFWCSRLTAEGIPWGGIPSHTTLFGDRDDPPVARLKSTYEEQIRAAAAQEERNRLARDLHDSIKQQLFVIQTAAATAEARFHADPEGARQAIEQVRSSAREAMTEMEVMLEQLSASPLENTGLVEALKKQCDALRFRTGADVRFTLGELPPNESLPPGTHEAMFRIAQEALANVARHARAAHVHVALEAPPLSLQLRVDDDGAGFDRATPRGGMGLGNMRARAAALGGTVAITTEPGKGTLVAVSVPRVSATEVDLRSHLLRVLAWMAPLLFWIFMAGLAIMTESRRATLIYKVPFVVVHAWILARLTAAYIRVRRIQSQRAAKAGAQ